MNLCNLLTLLAFSNSQWVSSTVDSSMSKIKKWDFNRTVYRFDNFTDFHCNHSFAWFEMRITDPALTRPYSHSKSCNGLHSEGLYSMIDLKSFDVLMSQSNLNFQRTKVFFLQESISGYQILVTLRVHKFNKDIILKLYDATEISKPRDILCYAQSCRAITTIPLSTRTSTSNPSNQSFMFTEQPYSYDDEYRKSILIYRIICIHLVLACGICMSIAGYFIIIHKQLKKDLHKLNVDSTQSKGGRSKCIVRINEDTNE